MGFSLSLLSGIGGRFHTSEKNVSLAGRFADLASSVKPKTSGLATAPGLTSPGTWMQRDSYPLANKHTSYVSLQTASRSVSKTRSEITVFLLPEIAAFDCTGMPRKLPAVALSAQ